MKLSNIVSYKVIESEKALVILYASDKLNMPGAQELIIADLATCCEFMIRYCEQRSDGKEPLQARELALRGARTLKFPQGRPS